MQVCYNSIFAGNWKKSGIRCAFSTVPFYCVFSILPSTSLISALRLSQGQLPDSWYELLRLCFLHGYSQRFLISVSYAFLSLYALLALHKVWPSYPFLSCLGFLQGFLQFSAELEWIVDLPFKVVAYGTRSLFLSSEFLNVVMMLITVCIS